MSRGTGKADVYAMLARPLAHTKSPGMFNALFEERQMDALMMPATCEPEDFDAFWAGLTTMSNLRGIVVSVPFKMDVFNKCQKAHARAARVSSANSVRRLADGSWYADNFDGVGFMMGLEQSGYDVRGQKVLQVGAGGAGASLAYCLAEAGAAAVTISDIDAVRAEKLALLVASDFPACNVSAGLSDPDGHSIIINATPMGLQPSDPLPLDADKLKTEMLVVDVIMEPRETPLLQRALQIGCRVQYGQPMMDCQMQAMAEFLLARD